MEELVTTAPAGGDPPWAIVYPASYEVGMANIGFHYVARMLKNLGVGVERFFTGPGPCERSLESNRRAGDFPVITASIAFEPDISVLLSLLERWNVPAGWKARCDSGGPLLGVGGALTYINPLSLAGSADFIVLGDGEKVLETVVVPAVREYCRTSDRTRFWETLAADPAVFVPPVELPEIVKRRNLSKRRNYLDNIDEAGGKSLWLTPLTAFGESLLLEVQRGCVRCCKYCTIPGAFGKPRFRSMDSIRKDIDSMTWIQHTSGSPRVGLVSPELGDYPELDALLGALRERGFPVSFASLRVDNLTPMMLDTLAAGGKHSLTIAPETGSDSLRFSCGKPFGNATILEKLKLASEHGLKRVKMYFMVGLPDEDEKDIVSIADLADEASRATGLRVTASVSVFVPKPGSVWHDRRFCGLASAKNRILLLRKAFAGKKTVMELKTPSPNEALEEYILAWADSGLIDPDTEAGKVTVKTMTPPDIARVEDQLSSLGYATGFSRAR